MKVRELEFFCNLVKRGSITDVAKAMHMTQPNASKMLKKLEEHFGLLLFERLNGRLHPTAEGRLLSEQAEASLISFQRLEIRARNLREVKHGSLAVGGTPQLSSYWLPSIMAQYMTSHPGVLTSIQTKDSRELIELVAQRQLDFALGTLKIADPNVEYRKVLETELLAALPKGHSKCASRAMRPAEFDKAEFITSSVLDHTREQVQAFFRSEGVEPIERGEASLSISRLRLVERGVGLAIIDSQTAGEQTSDSVEFRPLAPPQYLTLWAMRPRFQPKSKLVEAFETLVFDSAARKYGNDLTIRLAEPA